MCNSFLYALLFQLTFAVCCNAIEPITTLLGTAIVAAGVYIYKDTTHCIENECCSDKWINRDVFGLQQQLTEDLYGQHLVHFTLLRSLENHIRKKSPKKALVMSFHGWTGSGKNYASQMIVTSLFKKGTKSDFVHLYIGPKDFPHKERVQLYKDKLRREIEAATIKCERSVFIFDETEKMAPGVLDAITPYIDFHEQINGVNYRKNVFILLSNVGGNDVTSVALKFWTEGKKRNSIALKDVERVIAKGAFNEAGGLFHSEVVKKDLIDVYVPFLPLEKEHVKQCIQSELKAQDKFHLLNNWELINTIADELIYEPPEIELFSASGCKKVSYKVELHTDGL